MGFSKSAQSILQASREGQEIATGDEPDSFHWENSDDQCTKHLLTYFCDINKEGAIYKSAHTRAGTNGEKHQEDEDKFLVLKC